MSPNVRRPSPTTTVNAPGANFRAPSSINRSRTSCSGRNWTRRSVNSRPVGVQVTRASGTRSCRGPATGACVSCSTTPSATASGPATRQVNVQCSSTRKSSPEEREVDAVDEVVAHVGEQVVDTVPAAHGRGVAAQEGPRQPAAEHQRHRIGGQASNRPAPARARRSPSSPCAARARRRGARAARGRAGFGCPPPRPGRPR